MEKCVVPEGGEEEKSQKEGERDEKEISLNVHSR